MASDGCSGMQGHGRKEKQPKKKHKWSCCTYFVKHVTAKKNSNLAGMVGVTISDVLRGMSAKKGVRVNCLCL